MRTTLKKPTCIDLFCGAGGLSLGLKKAGFKSIYSVDSWAPAIETFNSNISNHGVVETIDFDFELPESDIVVGGPPCQGFSSAGLRKHDDERNTFVSVFGHLISDALPKAFIFENVEGFLTGQSSHFVFDLLSPLLNVGYWIRLKKINAANFGIPQHRKRVIVIGGLGFDPGFPIFSNYAEGAPGSHLIGVGLPESPTVMEAIGDLPEACKKNQQEIDGHFLNSIKVDDLKRIKVLKEGQTMKDLPENLWHETYRRRAYRRVMDGTPTARRGGAPAGMRRLRGNYPSKTITGGANREFLHPIEDRYLTLRECARLQSFPDTFQFKGNTSEQAQQIGNAVPPRLGLKLGKTLISNLPSGAVKSKHGRILEFSPTESSGMSPALKNLVVRVNETYHGSFDKSTKDQLELWV